MKKLVTFVLIGLLYVSVPEFTNLIVINNLPQGFVGAIVLYVVILTIGFFVQKLVERSIKNLKILTVSFIILFGFSGLMFEWFIIGHGPGSGAIQLGMFTYWVGLFMIPRILTDSSIAQSLFKKKVMKIFVVYLMIHLLLTLVIPNHLLPVVIPLLWTVVYTLFFILYYQYAFKTKKV